MVSSYSSPFILASFHMNNEYLWIFGSIYELKIIKNNYYHIMSLCVYPLKKYYEIVKINFISS